MALLIALLVFLAAILIALVFMINAAYNAYRIRVPYVPTPAWAVDWLVKNLALPPHSVLYELGCGDARIIAALAKKYPDSRFIGIEVQWWPYVLAKWRAQQIKNLAVERIDFWTRNISDATHVFGYYFNPILPRLAGKFKTELKPGTTVLSFGFHLPDWPTAQEIPNPTKTKGSRILFYRR